MEKIKNAFKKVKDDIENINFQIRDLKKASDIEIDKLIILERSFNDFSEIINQRISLEIEALRLEFKDEINRLAKEHKKLDKKIEMKKVTKPTKSKSSTSLAKSTKETKKTKSTKKK